MQPRELGEATVLDDGEPAAFGEQYRELREQFRYITVLGGFCGTDHRHIERIVRAMPARIKEGVL